MIKTPTGILILGILSMSLGPLTGVPGIMIGRRLANRGVLGDLGYFLCWLFSILLTTAAIIGFVAALTIPLWHR